MANAEIVPFGKYGASSMTTRKPNTPISPEMEAIIVRERLGDYAAKNAREAREHLVAAWRGAHPEAAEQPPSAGHRELVLLSSKGPGGRKDDPDETWVSQRLYRHPAP